ncbi:ATP-dependent zinc protease [Marinobacter daepoensis]|uniref:ATP-dependent zinc protease n=1 Tax=Marinobacter daepoensis TaxID=262077 RepID=A0ABS3BE89_9GAMM|nr:ATP-dependent zinc protease [Marinobacter daepoensis]MBN7770148.1 ATP-dependent zinc protease [Marinobacter daepoensis]MBY6033678.1 ATP-dependent zinc protease [Marinobacter daepoensis]MBY6079594.1 ATP-dependent zinc protease [Marinobacter daepoensis]
MRPVVITIALLSLFFSTAPALAETTEEVKPDPEIMGFVEWVVMGETGIRLKARLDTGAKTSSLHAVNVERFQKDNEDWVRFQLPLGDHKDQPTEGNLEHEEVILEFERPVYRTVLIKRKGAPSQRRYVVKMEFCIGGKPHETQFSLTDRGKFSYPVLLGRRFMRDDNILIDSALSFMVENECEYSTLEELAKTSEAVEP